MIRAARLKAFAKLNLGLRVLYKRPDGYHELRTVFQTISLADTLKIEFRRARETRITVEGTPEIKDNLVTRAAAAVLDVLAMHARIGFELQKSIPAGAGLGGGSSDAAAVLLALPVLAGKTIPMNQLTSIAAQLGSDVPFFLEGGTALGLGRGEELYPLPDRPATRALLVAPNLHSSTAEAYSDLSAKLGGVGVQNKLDSFRQEIWGASRSFRPEPENDFEPVVFARHPEVADIKTRLQRAGGVSVLMTGSGSSVFGIFSDNARLKRAQQSFSEKTYAISFVNRSQYRRTWQRALKSHTKGDQWPPLSLYAR